MRKLSNKACFILNMSALAVICNIEIKYYKTYRVIPLMCELKRITAFAYGIH